MESRRWRRRDVVLGGSLTRAPNGYRVTIQTGSPMYPNPRAMQELWAYVCRVRYPKAWDGREPEGALVVWWTPDGIEIQCGGCGRDLGDYVAYNAVKEYGIVEDTARIYHPRENFSGARPSQDPHDRLSRPFPRFTLDGEIVSRAVKTIACFKCRQCGLEYRKNLAELGLELFENPPRTYRLTKPKPRRRPPK